MTYDPSTRELRGSDGALLKTLHCPLSKRWQQLHPLDWKRPRKRYCENCRDIVWDITDFSEQQVKKLLNRNGDACVYVKAGARDIHVLPLPPPTVNPDGLRIIMTARTEADIKRAVCRGFRPLVKRVEQTDKIRSYVRAFQNRATGDVMVLHDLRQVPSPHEQWEEVLPLTRYYPDPSPFPIAAYLFPADLAVGETVWLDDLIDEFVAGTSQNNAWRLKSSRAIWTGTDFDIQYNEEKEAEHYIG